MKHGILIGLLSLLFFSCNQDNSELANNDIENELLILKNEYGIKYEKRILANIPKNALSINDLKRFFTSIKLQKSKSCNLTRSEWEGHHFPNLEKADCVGMPGDYSVSCGNDSLWTSIGIHGETILDNIHIVASCSFTRDTAENWPVPQSSIVRVRNDKRDCYLVDYAGNENTVLFSIISDFMFDVVEDLGTGYYTIWSIIWVFNIIGEIDIQNNIADMNLTTSDYIESPDHFTN